MLLLAGALVAETAPLIPLINQKKIWNKRLISGFCHGREVALLTTGVGPHKARARCLEALALLPVSRLVTLGTCGALRDELAIGQVVTGGTIIDESDATVDITPIRGFPVVSIITVTKAVIHAARRESLGQVAHICEMEAMGVFEAAAGLPVMALKVVSDQAGKEKDPALGGSIPGQGLAVFLARAGKLSHQHLKPAIEHFISSS